MHQVGTNNIIFNEEEELISSKTSRNSSNRTRNKPKRTKQFQSAEQKALKLKVNQETALFHTRL